MAGPYLPEKKVERIGEGAETTAPLATVVIGGLLFSTLLTVVVIPTVYLMFNRKTLKKEEELEKI